MTDLYTRVRRGARILDRHEPGWENRIDLDTLDLRSECNCVLGQVYGDFDVGLTVLDGDVEDAPQYYGFDVDDDTDEYPALTERWRGFLRRRLSRVAA